MIGKSITYGEDDSWIYLKPVAFCLRPRRLAHDHRASYTLTYIGLGRLKRKAQNDTQLNIAD